MLDNKKSFKVQVESELEELIPGFLNNRRNDVDKLRQMLAAQDFEAIKLVGHTMKGNGAGYGFDQISEIGQMIEATARDKKTDELEQLMLELSDFLNNVVIEYV